MPLENGYFIACVGEIAFILISPFFLGVGEAGN
jgi:hypothetical protein